MTECLQYHLSDVGESFDYLRSDIRNLSRSMAEREELIKDYRTFVTSATIETAADQIAMRKILKRTLKVLGPPPDTLPSS